MTQIEIGKQEGASSPERPKGGLRSYLGNSAWLMSDSLLTNLFSLLVLAIVARHLGPEEYGAYAYVFSLAQIFAVLGQMGLDGLLVRDLVNHPKEQESVIGTAGGLRFLGYGLGGLLCLLYAILVPGHDATERWLFVSAFLFILLTPAPLILENWFRSRVEARYSSIARMTGTLLGGALKIGLVLLGAGAVAIGFAQAATVVIVFLVSLPLFLRRGGPAPRRWNFESARAKTMLSECWLVFLGSLLAMIYFKIDQVMLRWWTSTEEVGIYAIASRMSEVCYFLPAAIVTTLFPRLIQLRNLSEQEFNANLRGLLALLSCLSYCTMIGVFLLGPFLIAFAFGEAYAAAVPVLFVHMCSMPFIFMRYAFSRWILIEKQLVFSVITQGCGAVTNVVLNIFLIPRYGMMGAAVATLFSYAAASYFSLFFSEKTRPVFFMMTEALLMPWKAGKMIVLLRNERTG